MNKQKTNTYEVKIDLHGLIKLLAKNLYAETDVFVRELLQNAHDSIQRRQEIERENAPAGVIRIRADRHDGIITFTDNGAGMTEEEVHLYLSTIGRSGTDEFRQKLMREGRHAETSLIGQFGIGLLSAFIVANTVVVETLSCVEGNPSWRWESHGDKDYTLGSGTRREPGTIVTLYVNIEKYTDVLLPDDLRKAIRKYAVFLPFPIYLNHDNSTINAINAPWHKTYSSEKEQLQETLYFLHRRYPDNPLAVVPVHLAEPYRVDGALYISDRQTLDTDVPGMVDIYQSRMFITANNRDLLPGWANFFRGVIDSPDFTPTAARDSVQRDGVFNAIRDELGRVIIDSMKNLAKQDSHRFERIMEWHSVAIKNMCLMEKELFVEVADLVPFETNEGTMSLKQYFDRSISGSKEKKERHLFYFSEAGSATQFYTLCNAKGLLVINASFSFEERFLEKYANLHPDVRLHQINIAGSEFIFEPLSESEYEQFRKLELDFRRVLPDTRSQVKVVRFEPTTIPAVTTFATDMKLRRRLEATRDNPIMPNQIRELLSDVLAQKQTVPLVLHLNTNNPTIQKLAEMNPNSEEAEIARVAIYHNALMPIAQYALTPNDIELIYQGFNRVIDRMISQSTEMQGLRRELTSTQLELKDQKQKTVGTALTEHVSCFVALPFDKEYNVLFQSLRELLETKPYFWQVLRADELHLADNLATSIEQHIARAHCYIAEVSDGNPNVFLELGMMKMFRRPTILLRRQGVTTEYADIKGAIYLSYPAWEEGEPLVEQLVAALSEEFEKNQAIKNLYSNFHYLSLSLMRQDWIPDRIALQLSKEYITVENFIRETPDEVARRIGLSRGGILADIQDYLRGICELEMDV